MCQECTLIEEQFAREIEEENAAVNRIEIRDRILEIIQVNIFDLREAVKEIQNEFTVERKSE